MDITDNLVYERNKVVTFMLKINYEERRVRFENRYRDYYFSNRRVWVSIPEKDGFDNRTYSYRGPYYSNKVRSAALLVKRIENRYILLDRYEVLKQDAKIVSWVNSKLGKMYLKDATNGYARACGTYKPYQLID